jgi:hypothetical protein
VLLLGHFLSLLSSWFNFSMMRCFCRPQFLVAGEASMAVFLQRR